MSWSQYYKNPLPTTSAVDSYVKDYRAKKSAEAKAKQKADDSYPSLAMRGLELKRNMLNDATRHALDFDKQNPTYRILPNPDESADSETSGWVIYKVDSDGNLEKPTVIGEEEYIKYDQYNKDVEAKKELILGGYLTSDNANNSQAFQSASIKAQEDAVKQVPPPSGVIKEKGMNLLTSAYKQVQNIGKEIKDVYMSTAKATKDFVSNVRDEINTNYNKQEGEYIRPVS